MKPHERLAKNLQVAHSVAREQVVHGPDLPQSVRTYLIAQGCLLEVMKGWYFLVPPSTPRGETALWHGNFWAFLGAYLEDRVGKKGYCLGAEISLDLHSGETRTPSQVTALLERGGNNTITLRFDNTDLTCSLLTYKDPNRLPPNPTVYRGLNIMPVGHALSRVTPTYFQTNRAQAEVLLRTTSPEDLAAGILEVNREAGAERILGGLEAIGFKEKADRVRAIILLTGWQRGVNPFPEAKPLLSPTLVPRTPHADRIKLLWQELRPVVLDRFPRQPHPQPPDAYLAEAREKYKQDAYHSLSIEGFQVTPDLIARISNGFEPNDPQEREETNRLAAKGYSLAHARVLESIGAMFGGRAPGEVVSKDLAIWYAELHRPFVQVGRLSPADCAGYRERSVFLRGSMYVPPPPGLAVMDGMEAYFECLQDETSPAVRAVLGNFTFVYIHPYPDGNGRLGRFVMNLMLASGGYPWTIVRVTQRAEYMAALEQASVYRNIGPFTDFLAQEIAIDWSPDLAAAERSERSRLQIREVEGSDPKDPQRR